MFLGLTRGLTDAEFLSWGWRVPFLASAVLVGVGLFIRLQLVETLQFSRLLAQGERVRIPIVTVFSRHGATLLLGTLAATATFVVFYLMTVFSLSWATSKLGFTRERFLELLMIGVLFFGATIPISALAADRIGARGMLIVASVALFALGFTFAPLLGAGTTAGVLAFLVIGLAATGLTYGPLGSGLATLFPTAIRYTGTSLAFNFAGILGASVAPYVATKLALGFGLAYVGYYLSGAATLSLLALLAVRAPPENPLG